MNEALLKDAAAREYGAVGRAEQFAGRAEGLGRTRLAAEAQTDIQGALEHLHQAISSVDQLASMLFSKLEPIRATSGPQAVDKTPPRPVRGCTQLGTTIHAQADRIEELALLLRRTHDEIAL